ncbi:methyl-accepting chemotaxis protein [Roseibium sp. Sym1]|uniref:methyl-accepting chemotaxis protein n=1 Tax=Roseibium sp. Sym1 TaxID=3016006 RepID=UPI0022B4EE40|nr:methyl-accepting chemotaxis protein [Roseibium sp. Sym1]
MSNLHKSASSRFKFRIAHKLVALLLVFSLVPAATIFLFYKFEGSEFRQAFRKPVEQLAVAIGDVIDRNLFERYGDVQAFALNASVKDTSNWGSTGADNPLIQSMNGYTTGYGIYRLMLVLDLDGNVVAANTVTATGKPLDTAPMIGKNFGKQTWFAKARDHEFLVGPNGMTGTAVEQPERIDIVANLYKDDGYVIPFSAPISGTDGKPIGVWVNFADFGLVEEIVGTFYNGLANEGKKSAEITVLDPEGKIIVDYDPVGQGWTTYRRNPDIIGKFNLAEKVEAAQKAVAGETGSMDAVHARKKVEQAAGYAHSDGAYDYPGLKWSVLVRIPVDEAYTIINKVNEVMVIVLAAAVVLIAGLGLFVGRAAAKPIQKMTSAMVELASGSQEALETVEVPSSDRSDELGDMAAAVQIFKENALERVRMRTEREAEQEARAARQQRVEELISSFRGTVQDVLQVVAANTGQMETSAASLLDTANETSSRANNVSAASEQASANVQSVASASEEMASSINEIARQISQTKATVEKANAATDETNAKIGGLAEAAMKIGEVVSLIQDIAEQTNLLALNATIEAARAGEAGRGFAVVAAEVKELATQTAKATEAISGQINGIQSETESSVQAIAVIAETMREIFAATEAIAASVEEQSASTSEISENVQQAAKGASEVSENIVGVSNSTVESQNSAEKMLTATREVTSNAERMQQVVDAFIADVTAA